MLTDPLWLFRRHRHIVPQQLEAQLRGLHPWTLSEGRNGQPGPSSRARADGVRIDLSRAEWIDLASLTQITLLLDALSREGVRTEIALPRRAWRRTEERYARDNPQSHERISRQLSARVQMAELLDSIGFVDALRALRDPSNGQPLEVLSDWDNSREAMREPMSGDDELEASDALEASAAAHRDALASVVIRKAVVRMRWITPGDAQCSADLSRELLDALAGVGDGTDRPDAKVLENVVLHEILENMVTHAGAGAHALIVGWAREPVLAWTSAQGWSTEARHAERLLHGRVPALEFVIGDSGCGLLHTLGPAYDLARSEGERGLPQHERRSAAVLQWAFHRWSSSQDRSGKRGTRGLYRLARVVRRYAGLTTIRAADEVVSLDHADPTREAEVGVRSLAASPGTTIRVLLPARVPSTGYAALAPEPESRIEFRLLPLGLLGPKGPTLEQTQQLERAFKQAPQDHNVCVAVEAHAPSRDAAVALLHKVSELRHPPQAIVTLEGTSAAEIAEWVSEANEAPPDAAEEPEAESTVRELFDPVMVLLPTGTVHWAGVRGAFAPILDELVAAPDGTLTRDKLLAVAGTPAIMESFRRHLREDPHLVVEDRAGNVQLQVTVAGLARHARAKLSEAIAEAIVTQHATLGTHDLWRTRAWLPFPLILQTTCGRALARALLAWRARLGVPTENWEATRRILVGESQSSMEDLAVLRDALRCEKEWLLPDLAMQETARDGRAFSANSDVVIHADIVASGEAVARCVRQAQRELCKPVLITCFVDARPTAGAAFEFKGIHCPIVSLIQAPELSNVAADVPVDAYIDALNGDREPETPVDPSDEDGTWRLTPDLANELAEAFALYFSHVSRPNGRHFTIGGLQEVEWVN